MRPSRLLIYFVLTNPERKSTKLYLPFTDIVLTIALSKICDS